jgi:hypothetical protein
MGTMLIKTWTRYFNADRRQLPLFPEWERMRWLSPLPSLGAAFGLGVLVAVGTPWSASDVIERTTLLMESTDRVEEPAAPQYDLAAIPAHIKAAAQRHRLSEELISAVISVESNFDHAAVSRKGARGLMQLMPATASIMGVRDPHDPDENIDAGASHLRAMLDTFKGDLPLALAAYNAGEQHVIRHRGIPPFQETRQFVARVLRRMGDKKAAETVLARPIPPPQWVARSPRAPSKAHMVSTPAVYPSAARPTMVQVPAPRISERAAAQLVLNELEQRPSARTWSSLPTTIKTVDTTVDTSSSMPAPTVLMGQAP